MTRRRFAAAVASLVALVVAPRASSAAPYGHMTVDRWHREGMRDRGARTLIDGRDITDECVAFDDRFGWADVLLRNPEGKHYLRPDRTGPAQARLHGRIEVVFGKRT